MDKYPLLEIIKSIELVKKNIDPDIVYTHSGADLNIDHRVVANAVITVFDLSLMKNVMKLDF